MDTLVGRAPFLLSSEYVSAWVDSPEHGDPNFWGGYATVSYVLTGLDRVGVHGVANAFHTRFQWIY